MSIFKSTERLKTPATLVVYRTILLFDHKVCLKLKLFIRKKLPISFLTSCGLFHFGYISVYALRIRIHNFFLLLVYYCLFWCWRIKCVKILSCLKIPACFLISGWWIVQTTRDSEENKPRTLSFHPRQSPVCCIL